ncbi:MAG: hypothetical protein ABI672_16700 [Vicinamibacteria bacterium]
MNKIVILSMVLLMTACENPPVSQSTAAADRDKFVGAWHSKISFRSGPLSEMKGLEFFCVYNTGGTMTESSNYDEAANSSPPAYGVWKAIDARTFETKYLFFTTDAPRTGEGTPNAHDWWPAGHGVITETVTLSVDGRSYTSAIRLATFDKTGAPVANGGGEGTTVATRIAF